jgi:glycosyltransferase involved in cell wall biosynthesis
MRISLIVDPYGEEKPGGLGRAIFQMANGIIKYGKENEFVVYLKETPKQPPAFEGNFTTVALNVKRLWLNAGKKLKKDSDLYIFFTPIIPLLFFPKKSIVVVHDFAYLESRSGSLKQRLASTALWCLHKISLSKATAIAAVSESARQDAIHYFNIAPQKITVIYNGFIPLGSEAKEIEVPERFFLFAGVLKARKNVLGVIHAFAEFAQSNDEYSLVIAGKTGGAYAKEAEWLTDDLGIAARVRFAGYVTDAELHYLYTKATALVFPSFIEGFGMPVLEAMDLGLPVITSNTGALAEVAGEAALLVNPHDPSDIARAMNIFARDTAKREEYVARGKARAAQFSWEKNGKEFAALIEAVK